MPCNKIFSYRFFYNADETYIVIICIYSSFLMKFGILKPDTEYSCKRSLAFYVMLLCCSDSLSIISIMWYNKTSDW